MDDTGPTSPIIRSSWKPKPAELHQPVLPAHVSPTSSFLSTNTVSPLSGFRESATVTDVSWATAFQTPTKCNTSTADPVNRSADVFMTTSSEQYPCLPQQSEIDISFKNESSKCDNSENDSSSIVDTKITEHSPTKTKELSTSEVLSNFRNNALQRVYPKPPTPKIVAKNTAFYSTPKADRPMLKMPQPPTSAIMPSSKYQGSAMRLKVCPCGTCSCPAVYLKDAGVQTNENNVEKQEVESYEMGGLTQLAAQEIGRYDGFTQQSINLETAKANRTRPKSVVHFQEPPEDSADTKTERITAGSSFISFRKAGSGDVLPKKAAFNARKFFGDDFDSLDVKNEISSNKSLPTSGFSSLKKAPRGQSATPEFDAKKIFGEDFENLKSTEGGNSFQSAGAKHSCVSGTNFLQKSLPKPVGSSMAKLTEASPLFNSSIAELSKPANSNAKKLFGDDFPVDLPQNQFSGFKSARKSVPSDTIAAAPKSADPVAHARSIFGDDLDAIMAEMPPSSSGYTGFQPSKKLASVGPEESKTPTLSETNFISCSAVPEGSDVESIYDEDIDSNNDAQNVVVDEPEMEVEEEQQDSLSIPPELFFQAFDQTFNLGEHRTMEARAEQQRIIAEKSSTSPSKTRSHGIMWRTRLFASEKSLLSVATLSPDFANSASLDGAILQVVTNPYSSYRFPAQFSDGNSILQWQTVDGGLLVAASDGTIGLEELKTCLLTTPGVDPRLIPEGWVDNHYRWIIWKLCKEVFAFCNRFPDPYSRLNPECVMQQLKYRYDRELDSCKRPCLRRIVEKDSSSKIMMMLCVSKIIQSSHQQPKPGAVNSEDEHSKDSTSSTTAAVQIELTDGWYCVLAQLDAPLQRMVSAGRIFVGCKLVIAGAELNGLDEGVDPLHIPSSCHLRICANSTRLVRQWWSARLGFVVGKKLCVPMRSLFAGGGNATAIKAVVGRVYPLLFVEKRVSTNGVASSIYRLESDEAAESERAKAAQERKVEELMSKMTADSQSPRPGPKRRKITSAELNELCTGEEIAIALRQSFDPESVEQMLSETQREALRQYMASRNDQMARKIQAALQQTGEEESCIVRNVTPVLKVFIIGISNLDRQSDTSAVLSIWRPPENALDLLQEGSVYYFYNVTVSRPPSSFNQFLLNGTQLTSWQAISGVNCDDIFVERVDTPLREISQLLENSKTASYTNRETDMVGIALRPVTEQAGCRRLFFVDSDGDVGVLQGTSISFNSFLANECARQTVPGTFIASNLRLTSTQGVPNQTGFSSTAIPTLFAQDYSNFTYLPASTTAIPPRISSNYRHLEAAIKTALVNRTSLVESGLRKLETVAKLSPLSDEASRSISRTDFRNSLSNAETGPQRPGSSNGKTPLSTDQQVTGHELQKRKMEKLDRLVALADSSLLGEPSPLPNSSMSARSRSVLKRAFRTPFKSNEPTNNNGNNN